MLYCRLRSGGSDPRTLVGPRRCRGGGPRKTRRFLRDFRGDTIHPSTLEILDELGLAERFLKELPHTEVSRLVMRLPSGAQLGIDFRRLPTRFPFFAFVPQWDFLRFVTTEAARYPSFTLVMQAEVEDLIVRLGLRVPLVRDVPARVIALGLWRPRVRTPG